MNNAQATQKNTHTHTHTHTDRVQLDSQTKHFFGKQLERKKNKFQRLENACQPVRSDTTDGQAASLVWPPGGAMCSHNSKKCHWKEKNMFMGQGAVVDA